MATIDSIRNRASDAGDQIAQLRAQVETLMNDRVTPAISEAAGRAESMARAAGGVAREQADNVTSRVRQSPMLAVLIAGAAGFLLGRLFR